jgi:hypothetical protein
MTLFCSDQSSLFELLSTVPVSYWRLRQRFAGLWSYRVSGFFVERRQPIQWMKLDCFFERSAYELGFETCRHRCQAFIFRAAFVNSIVFSQKASGALAPMKLFLQARAPPF